MSDKIVYTLVTHAGGIDGMDYTNKGGKITAAYFDKIAAQNDGNRPWCDIVPIVIDTNKARREALGKLSAIDKLVLGVK